MKNERKTSGTVLTAFLLCALALSSCGEQKPAESASSEAPGQTPETEAAPAYLDHLPGDLDLGGYAVRVYCGKANKGTFNVKAEDTADIISDLLYKRNRKIEERLNCTLAPVEYEGNGWDVFVSSVNAAVLAGDDTFDMLTGGMWWSTPLSFSGVLYDMADGAYLELDQPWWATDYIRGLSYKNHICWVTGPLDLTWTSQKQCDFVNLNLWRSLYDEDIYDIVDQGGWTIEKLNICITETYQDLNGDSKVDENDRLGFGYPTDMMVECYAYASGVEVAPFDADGVPHLAFVEKPERLIRFWEEIYKVKSNPYTLPIEWTAENPTTEHELRIFNNGNLLFATGTLAHTTSNLRGMKDDYGILPLPKLDSEQKTYTTVLHDGVQLYGLPVTVSETGRDAAFAVLEAAAAEGYASIIPAYYEDALKNKYIRDERSIDIINMLSENPICDFGAQYLDLGFYKFLRQEVTTAEIASKIEKKAKTFRKTLDTMLSQLENQ